MNIRLLVETQHRQILIPTAAIQRGQQGTFVYVITGDTAHLKTVQMGITEGNDTAIRSGINEGDVVVTDGTDKLQTGTKVRVRPNAPGQKGPQTEGRGGGSRRRSGLVNISRLFILRPVATALLMVAVILVGVVAFRQLPISALPQVDYPTIQVQTFYPGASPDVMATSVTAPLERQFGQVPGLSQMNSISSFGSSVITLQFSLELNIDVAEQEVQAAINASGSYLPKDLPNPPIYSKTNPADSPILTLCLTSSSLPLPAVEELADTRLAQKISQLPGVGPGQHQRRPAACGTDSGQPASACVVRNESGDVTHGSHAGQCQPGEGQLRWPPASVDH